MTSIICRACNRALPHESFYPSIIVGTKKFARCKSCFSERAKQWERAHPEYRKSHHKKALNRQWREKNKDYMRQKLYQWRKDNPEKAKEISKRSRQKNIQKILIRNREREILEKTAMPPWADRKKIHALYAEAKRLTKATGIRHEVDHIYPLRGKYAWGLHVEGNLRIITATENRKKHNKMPEGLAC